jgi:putative membrane protein
MMHWGNLSGIGYNGFGFGWIFMFLFWAMVILGIIYFIKQLSTGSGRTLKNESAEDILKKRYAAGEISTEEFNKKLALILK